MEDAPALGHARVRCACFQAWAAAPLPHSSQLLGPERVLTLPKSHSLSGWAAEPQGRAQCRHWVTGLDSSLPSSASSVTFGPSLKPCDSPGQPRGGGGGEGGIVFGGPLQPGPLHQTLTPLQRVWAPRHPRVGTPRPQAHVISFNLIPTLSPGRDRPGGSDWTPPGSSSSSSSGALVPLGVLSEPQLPHLGNGWEF